MPWFYHIVPDVLTSWGYLALLAGLFRESMGLPLPGETLLMFSSFLTRKQTHLQMQWVIPVGIFAAVMGDNLGYSQLSSQLSQTVLYKSSGIFTYTALGMGADLASRYSRVECYSVYELPNPEVYLWSLVHCCSGK